MRSIDSGANMNFDRLRHVAERAELGERREVLFAATIPERPGSFRSFCETIGQRGITEFNYRYADADQAHVFVGVKMHGLEEEKQALFADLRAKGYPIEDMSDNEMAKVHVRYMVGGRVGGLANECLFRFEFPERPGALMRFLNRMGEHWREGQAADLFAGTELPLVGRERQSGVPAVSALMGRKAISRESLTQAHRVR